MSAPKNITLKDFRKFLEHSGCTLQRTKGGHEMWSKPGLIRPVVIQSHKNPVPTNVVRSCLKTLGLSPDELNDFLNR